MASVIQPNAWIGLKLPSENVRFLRIVPNTIISLGKYGSFPSNLLIHRPYHLTYELLDKQDPEAFSRLRVIPTDELYADVFADEARAAAAIASGDDADADADADTEYTLVDIESQAVIARSNSAAIDADARQTLPAEEIEALKREGTGAGRDLIAKLLLSHAALDQKTAFSLAKYKLLKAKKYIRRFMVLPLDVCTLGNWLLDDKDVGSKILELRDEMVALLGCWANVHYGGPDRYLRQPSENGESREDSVRLFGDRDGGEAQQPEETVMLESDSAYVTIPPEKPPVQIRDLASQLGGGRWLIVDDTGGLLVAAMAERMGILYNDHETGEEGGENKKNDGAADEATRKEEEQALQRREQQEEPSSQSTTKPAFTVDTSSQIFGWRPKQRTPVKRTAHDDFNVPFSLANTLTLLHTNSQANLTYLKYFGYDNADPNPPPHPLNNHLLSLSWLQLLEPESDTVYAQPPPIQPPDVVAAWKPARRGNYHRKRRRWARTRHIVDATRAGGFSGLVVATSMDLISTLRHALPLLASGAPVAIYSPCLESLTALADCFSIARRTAWSGPDPPAAVQGKTVDELERWPGSEEFPLNPMLLLGVTVQTSRARKWQVLPGRTHPLMTARGGAEGYIFTGWKAKPAEGRVTARGKFKKRKTADSRDAS